MTLLKPQPKAEYDAEKHQKELEDVLNGSRRRHALLIDELNKKLSTSEPQYYHNINKYDDETPIPYILEEDDYATREDV